MILFVTNSHYNLVQNTELLNLSSEEGGTDLFQNVENCLATSPLENKTF